MSNEFSPGLDVRVFESVLAFGDAARREVLARQLTALFTDPETPQIEIAQVRGFLLRLAQDEEKAVRQAIAEGLAQLNRDEADLAFTIAADEEDIALPFLASSQILNAEQIVAIMKVGGDSCQVVLAGRPDLPPEAIDYVVGHCQVNVAVALLANDVLALSEAQLRALYRRFSQDAELVARLLAVAELPLDIRINEARKSSLRLRQAMADKGWMAATDAIELCTDAEDMAVIDVLLQATPAKRAQAVAYMASTNLLTPAFLIRASANGQMIVVEAGLAHLSGLDPRTAALRMYDRNPSPFRTLYRRSGLPQSCYGVIRAACDVVIDMREVGIELTSAEFGSRILEALMTRYEEMTAQDRARQIEYLGRYADEKVRRVARRMKMDMLRAA